MQSAQNNTLLELHVSDFEITKDFYKKLGFEVVWERAPEAMKGYLVMKLENNILCFWPGNETIKEQLYFQQFPANTPRGYGVEIVIIVENAESLYSQIKNVVEIYEPLKNQPWGLKDFRLADPFGYYLRFTEPHNILDSENAVS